MSQTFTRIEPYVIDVPDFDSLYRADPDPWRVRSSFYEQRKLQVVLATLGAARYASAWDPACGVGELAARLAPRATRVLATDASAEAVSLTRTRCQDLSEVTVRRLALPTEPAAGSFDLVVISEFFYYLTAADRRAALTMIDAQLGPDGELVSLHWRHKPHDAHLSGAEVQLEIGRQLQPLGWRPVVRHDDRDFVLTTFERAGR